jgi:Na+-driven multidrug efflux pump
MGANGVWMSFVIAEFATGIISYFIYQKYAKKTIE